MVILVSLGGVNGANPGKAAAPEQRMDAGTGSEHLTLFRCPGYVPNPESDWAYAQGTHTGSPIP